MLDFIADTIEYAHESSEPKYAQMKNNALESCRQVEMASTAVLITSVALAIFGLTAGSFGLPIIFVAVPLCFFSYNGSRTFANLNDVINNPKRYLNLSGSDNDFNTRKLKGKLVEGTFCFHWAIDYCVDYLIAQAHHKKTV